MKQYKIKIGMLVACSAGLFFTSCQKIDIGKPAPIATKPVSTTGVVTTVAGNGTATSANGAGTAASFAYPMGVAVDAAGNLYVADQGNNEIRKITTTGAVSVFAGSLISGNGNATAALSLFTGPTGVAVDATGANVYVADYGNNLIRKISGGNVTTLAGGSKAGKANGTGTAATFSGPAGVAVDAAGNVYVADFVNNLIRKITAAGVVTTLAGSGTAGNANGTGTAASFNGPRSVALDAAGNVYVADANNNLIREITPAGVVTTLAGSGSKGNTDGTGTAASFYYPSGVAVDGAGNVYVADADNNLIRKITPTGAVTSLAGSGYVTLTTPFNGPVGVAVNSAGTIVYVADAYNNIIQKVQ
jgi:DNA-binding beta-propeller fold protein YncE